MSDKINKTYADCFLYKKHPAYSAILVGAIMESTRIDKEAKGFEDVIYEVKRTKVNSSLLKVLSSKNTQLIIPPNSLPKSFKVFCAKDAKEDKDTVKVFIDCTNAIRPDTNGFDISEGVLVSYLINAEVAMVYNMKPNMVINNSKLRETGANCFAALLTHIVDYIGKISIVEGARDKCLYLTSRYYLTNVLMLESETTIRDLSRKIAGITETKESTYDFMITKNHQNPFKDIKEFCMLLREVFKLESLTTDLIVEKWMYLYGEGTAFGLEFYPAFSAMLTDAYTGSYINNQKTIDKICGRYMIDYAKSIIYDLNI